MTIALVILGLLCAALLAERAWERREAARERRELIDRITVPDAARAAAFARAIDAPPPRRDTDAEDDARFGRELGFDEDLSLTEIGATD